MSGPISNNKASNLFTWSTSDSEETIESIGDVDYQPQSSSSESADQSELIATVSNVYKKQVIKSSQVAKKPSNKPLNAGIKKGRTVKPASANLAPSTTQDNNPDIKELMIDHGSMRIQLEYIRFLALAQLGVRSDGTTSDVQVTVEHANYQFGKGNAKKGTHAAHSTAIAGCTDNLRDQILTQIAHENTVTPKKLKILAAKQFPKEAIDKLTDPSTTTNEIRDIFKKYWPKEHFHESILSGTDLEATLNATNELPRSLNLKCDKSLEAFVRPQVAELITEVLLGKITPEKATKRYWKMINQHFNTVIPILDTKIRNLDKYLARLKEIKSFQGTSQELIQLLEKLSSYQKKLVEKQTGVAKTILKENESFVRSSLNKLKKSQLSVASFQKLTKNKYHNLKNEVDAKHSDLEKLLEYNVLEKEGSILPDFAILSGYYSPTSNQFKKLSPQSFQNWQYQTISNSTDRNSNAKKRLDF